MITDRAPGGAAASTLLHRRSRVSLLAVPTLQPVSNVGRNKAAMQPCYCALSLLPWLPGLATILPTMRYLLYSLACQSRSASSSAREQPLRSPLRSAAGGWGTWPGVHVAPLSTSPCRVNQAAGAPQPRTSPCMPHAAGQQGCSAAAAAFSWRTPTLCLGGELGQGTGALAAGKGVGAVEAVKVGACAGQQGQGSRQAGKAMQPQAVVWVGVGARACVKRGVVRVAASPANGSRRARPLLIAGAGQGSRHAKQVSKACAPGVTSSTVPHTAMRSGLAPSAPLCCASCSSVSCSSGTTCTGDGGRQERRQAGVGRAEGGAA